MLLPGVNFWHVSAPWFPLAASWFLHAPGTVPSPSLCPRMAFAYRDLPQDPEPVLVEISIPMLPLRKPLLMAALSVPQSGKMTDCSSQGRLFVNSLSVLKAFSATSPDRHNAQGTETLYLYLTVEEACEEGRLVPSFENWRSRDTERLSHLPRFTQQCQKSTFWPLSWICAVDYFSGLFVF